MLYFYALSGLINGIIATIFGFFVFFKNPKSIVNKAYGLLSLCIAVWGYAYYFWPISQSSKENVLLSFQILHIGAIFIAPSFLYFTLALLNLHKKKKSLINLCYFIGAIFVVLNFTPFFIKDIVSKFYFNYWAVPGIAYHFYLLFWSVCVIYAWYLIISKYKELSGFKQNQIKYVLIASIIGFVGGATNYPLWYDIPIPPIGTFFVSIHVLILAYAIVKYRLMDITVTITRTGVFVGVYTLVLGLPFVLATLGKAWLIEFLGANWWIAPLALMAGLATAGPFVYIYLQRRAEAVLLREQKRYQDTLKQAAVGMTRIRDLDKLLRLIVHIVTKTVRIHHSSIYLYDADSEGFLLEAGRNVGKTQPDSINNKSSLVIWLRNQKESLVYEEVKRRAQDNHSLIFKELERQMRELGASVIIPSLVEDRLLGLLILGDKRSGAIYTQDDLDIFSVLASQAALAIENALFILEAKKMQEQISQAEKMATIGTMADGLSHQINNRLHALSMISGDTLDTLKLTDTKDYPQETKELLGQITHALERIQANVMQGKEVVSGLLKYSRKGEAGFSAISIDEILDGALEMVKFKVRLSEFDLMRDYPKSLPKIKVNLTQLEEVFFNLIDNAYDAITERRQILKEDGFRGRITVSCRQSTDNFMEIIFADNGIGLKEGDRRKLFTPFFTTKVSSRRGTGLGLFVIQRIITQMHKGEIRFESEYSRGTRFVLKLPVAK